jgi:type IV pilus biogenesis protein CpaD/CtpE
VVRLEEKSMRLILVAVVSALLAGCASGSALVTGQARPAIADHTTVRVLTEKPEGAEEIAIVKASSDSGLTQQNSLDYAVDELKKQAAKVGANAVVLTNRDTSSQVVGVPAYGGGTIVGSSEVEIVQGIAVWVEQQ